MVILLSMTALVLCFCTMTYISSKLITNFFPIISTFIASVLCSLCSQQCWWHHCRQGSFGWSTNGNTWIAGKSTRSYKGFKSGILCEGTEVIMTLDCRPRYNTLTLHVNGGNHEYQLADLPRNQWRLQVVLYGNNDEIRIQNIKKVPGSHILK